MSRAEIISEIPKLSHADRREIMRYIIESEEDAQTLADCDQRALKQFQTLDAMEAEDEKNATRRNLACGFWPRCQSSACAYPKRLSRLFGSLLSIRHWLIFNMPTRYGTGELFGFDFTALSPERIRELSTTSHKLMDCPFKPIQPGKPIPKCNKKGGVCSLRQFSQNEERKVEGRGEPVTTCPNRFLEGNLVSKWVGETLLGTANPVIISQLPFLMGEIQAEEEADQDAVGKIDEVLVNPEGQTLQWCALEFQAVYFSGSSMENDFKEMRNWTGPGIPFPKVQRRPDFRSSGPKRLMPQLQIKVPTISRWGKKMAVVIDWAFWESLGTMREVKDLSNCEIVWFVVSFAPAHNGHFTLQRHETHFTTLDNAVEGLTGGTPMSLDRFEKQIRARLPPS
ncbi:MAG TPA: NotI family restriction endonuclease [Verrucomicrobiae bacterium]|jgi:hypothetical protein